jgi:3',5'-cyclic-AMP phosphodiesterase
MRLAWITDIHLNFLTPFQVDKFLGSVAGADVDGVIISGDIAESQNLIFYLKRMESRLQKPIYFVLGNHDFYNGSIAAVRSMVTGLSRESKWLRWLTAAGVIELTPEVGLVGHDSWADGRFGDYDSSPLMLTDYVLIPDLALLDKEQRLYKLNALGEEAANYFRDVLPRAFERYSQVLLVTHAPPFRELAWYDWQPHSADIFLPHFSCKAVGEALTEIMAQYPRQKLTVLCGHVHMRGRFEARDNLLALCGDAKYGAPKIEDILEF